MKTYSLIPSWHIWRDYWLKSQKKKLKIKKKGDFKVMRWKIAIISLQLIDKHAPHHCSYAHKCKKRTLFSPRKSTPTRLAFSHFYLDLHFFWIPSVFSQYFPLQNGWRTSRAVQDPSLLDLQQLPWFPAVGAARKATRSNRTARPVDQVRLKL